MPSLATILLAWGIIAPLATYGWLKVQTAIAVHDAKNETERTTRLAQQAICSTRITELQGEVNRQAEETAALITKHEAQTKVPEKGELKAICKGDRACRERGSL